MAMQGYTKLFNSILASSIWSEPDHTRIVWITMLAMADKNGDVAAALPGLAALSRIDIERCKQAIATLEATDQFSRTAEFEGRRIEKIDGGWHILNYLKFKRLLSIEERREYLALKQREHRERVKQSQSASTPSTHTDSDTDSNLKEESKTFCVFWNLYPRKVGKEKATKIWHTMTPKERDAALEGLKLWKHAEQWHRGDGEYIPYGSTFLAQRRWADEPWTGAFSEGQWALKNS
jgi:hypothetical protein